MSTPTLTPQAGASGVESEAPLFARDVAGLWWLWLVTGIAWLAAALIVLQFDRASITTIGIIVGCMFIFAGIQQIVVATIADSLRWLWAIFGALFIVAGIVCFVNPEATFVGLADTLGFLFLLVGAWWTIEAVLARDTNPLWWLGLIGGILMLIIAFWTSGQFFFEKAYTLLVMAGIWALMTGITDIVRAFQIRRLRSS